MYGSVSIYIIHFIAPEIDIKGLHIKVSKHAAYFIRMSSYEYTDHFIREWVDKIATYWPFY